MPKSRVFVDTNVILEAFRTKTWDPVCNKFAIETVEKCVEETLTGDLGSHNHIFVNPELLKKGLAERHSVKKHDIASLIFEYPECQGLDDGELHLFALLHAKKILKDSNIRISTADKAAIRAAHTIGWGTALVTFEELLRKTGLLKKIDLIRPHFGKSWLSDFKTKLLLEMI